MSATVRHGGRARDPRTDDERAADLTAPGEGGSTGTDTPGRVGPGGSTRVDAGAQATGGSTRGADAAAAGSGAVTDDELAAVVRVVLVAAATLLGVAAAAWWHLGPWLPTAVGAVAVAVLGRRMPAPLLALAAFLAWCTVTGFATNAEAELTFDASDAARLGTLVGAALVGRLVLGRVLPDQGKRWARRRR